MVNNDESRAYTADEVREQLIGHLMMSARYWARVTPTAEDIARAGGEALYRLEGLVHSVLATLDGVSSLPGFDLYTSTAPGDRAYHEDNGDNWYDDEVCVNGSGMMHDEMPVQWGAAPKPAYPVLVPVSDLEALRTENAMLKREVHRMTYELCYKSLDGYKEPTT